MQGASFCEHRRSHSSEPTSRANIRFQPGPAMDCVRFSQIGCSFLNKWPLKAPAPAASIFAMTDCVRVRVCHRVSLINLIESSRQLKWLPFVRASIVFSKFTHKLALLVIEFQSNSIQFLQSNFQWNAVSLARCFLSRPPSREQQHHMHIFRNLFSSANKLFCSEIRVISCAT